MDVTHLYYAARDLIRFRKGLGFRFLFEGKLKAVAETRM